MILFNISNHCRHVRTQTRWMARHCHWASGQYSFIIYCVIWTSACVVYFFFVLFLCLFICGWAFNFHYIFFFFLFSEMAFLCRFVCVCECGVYFWFVFFSSFCVCVCVLCESAWAVLVSAIFIASVQRTRHSIRNAIHAHTMPCASKYSVSSLHFSHSIIVYDMR